GTLTVDVGKRRRECRKLDLTRMLNHARLRQGLRVDPNNRHDPVQDDDNSLRTDLALEARQIALDDGRVSSLPGVESVEETLPYGNITRLTVQNEVGARLMGKPVGTYTTLQIPELHERRR